MGGAWLWCMGGAPVVFGFNGVVLGGGKMKWCTTWIGEVGLGGLVEV